MLIAPKYEGDITQFYDLYVVLTEILESGDEPILENQVQPAFFHRDWSFDGVDEDAPINYEKRAPCTVINLLRRAQLDSAVAEGLERGVIVNKDIAEHNAHSLDREGTAAMRSVFEKIRTGALEPSVEPAV